MIMEKSKVSNCTDILTRSTSHSYGYGYKRLLPMIRKNNLSLCRLPIAARPSSGHGDRWNIFP